MLLGRNVRVLHILSEKMVLGVANLSKIFCTDRLPEWLVESLSNRVDYMDEPERDRFVAVQVCHESQKTDGILRV